MRAITPVVLVFGVAAALVALLAYETVPRYAYGRSHCCLKALGIALIQYAESHHGRYPSGESSPEASLSLLYREHCTDAGVLRGKIVPLEVVEEILQRGDLLGPDSCGWHYVEGLTRRDGSTGPTATPNSVNYNNAVGNVTDVGAYAGTISPCGAFDMGGNVFQGTDTYFPSAFEQILAGGAWNVLSSTAGLTAPSAEDPTTYGSDIGFRVAMIPEPSTIVLAALAVVAILPRCRRGLSHRPPRRG